MQLYDAVNAIRAEAEAATKGTKSYTVVLDCNGVYDCWNASLPIEVASLTAYFSGYGKVRGGITAEHGVRALRDGQTASTLAWPVPGLCT